MDCAQNGKGKGNRKGKGGKGKGKFGGGCDEDGMPSEADAELMETLRQEAEHQARDVASDDGSDQGDALPPPASEAEIEEARQIVQKAQLDAAERERMKVKAKSASRDDLQ